MKTYDDRSNTSSYSMSSINASITRNNSWNILQTFVNCQSLLRQRRAIHQLIKCLNGWEQSLKFHLTDYSNAFNAKLCNFLKEVLWRVSPLSNIFGCIRSGLKYYNLAIKITLIQFQEGQWCVIPGSQGFFMHFMYSLIRLSW